MNDHKFLSCALAVALSSVMMWFGTALNPVWWLTWIASLPVLLIAARVSGRIAFLAALAAWAIGGLNQWSYLHGLIALPWQIAVLADLRPALVFAVAVILWRAFVMRGMLVRAGLGFAGAWVCYEFWLQRTSVHSTWGNIAYSQMNCLPVLQLASLAGVAGISFLLFFVPGTLATLLSPRGTQRDRLIALICAVIPLVIVLGWGTWRLSVPSQGTRLRVGLAASDTPRNLRPRDPEQIRKTFTQYAAASKRLIEAGARLIVLPEKDAIVSGEMTGETDRIFAQATQGAAILAVGVERWTPGAKLNEIRVYGPNQRLWATYEKHHMLPAFESDLLPGTTLTTLQQPSGKWGMEICKDLDFPSLSRKYGNQGIGLLIVPAWDFNRDGWYHARMAILRGVESGFSIVRAPKQGVLTVSDDRGRVLAERQTNSAEYATLLASVPVDRHLTLYDRWGDWFGWANIGLFACVLASGFGQRKTRPLRT